MYKFVCVVWEFVNCHLFYCDCAGFISEPIFRPYMALKDCIPVETDAEVKEGEDPQLEEEDGVGVSLHHW